MKILFFGLCLLTYSARAQYTFLVDPGFISWLDNNGFHQCLSGNQLDTTCPQVLNAKYLNISYQRISNLDGIEYFKGLDTLRCNADTILDYIPALPPHLKFLECRNNGLTLLPSLPDSLQGLACEANRLTALPPLPPTLRTLLCYNNLLQTLPPLPPLLQALYCSGNQLQSLPALPDSLQVLSCFSNQLSQLPALPNAMLQLSCAGNPLHTLPTLPPLLQNLDCSTDSLTVLPVLPDSLNYLGCYHNQLTTIPTLPSALTILNCGYNNLNSLPDLPDSLNLLFCNDNLALHCMPVINTIWDFEFYNTGITCLPDYGNVYISEPTITSLPICDSLNNTHGCMILSGVNEVGNVSIKLYPNPAKDLINLEFQFPVNKGVSFELLNQLGQTVIKQQLRPGQTLAQYPTGNLSSAIYYWRLRDSQRTIQTGKVAIMK